MIELGDDLWYCLGQITDHFAIIECVFYEIKKQRRHLGWDILSSDCA